MSFDLPHHHHPTRLDDIPEEAYPLKDIVNRYVKQEAENRWRCRVPGCVKLFQGPQFWRKHVKSRHSGWLEKLEKENPQDSSIEQAMPQEQVKQVDQQSEAVPVKRPQIEKDDTSTCGSWEAVSWPGDYDVKVVDDHQLDEAQPTKDGYNDFFDAAARGDVDELKAKLVDGFQIEEQTAKGFTALAIAIMEEQVDAVRFLLQRGADPHHRVKHFPPLAYAATRPERGPEFVQLLLDHGVNVNTVSGRDSKTALHLAVCRGRANVVEFLLDRGMDIEKRCRRGCTPLLLAAATGKTEVAKLLLERGAKLDARSNNGATVITWSACDNHVETMKFWLHQGAEFDTKDNQGFTALFLASHFGCLDAVKLLLEKGADPSIISCKLERVTAAMAAASAGHTEVLKALIAHGCDLDVKNTLGDTVLDVAIVERKLDATQVLLDAMSRGSYHPKNSVSLQVAMAKTRTELKALVSAASLMYPYVGFKFETSGEYAWMEWVLNEGGSLVKPRAMRKLLHTALEDSNIEMVKALATQGCDMTLVLDSGLTPTSIAVQNRDIPMLRVLIDVGADPGQPSNNEPKRTPLDDIILDMNPNDEKDLEIIDILLSSGRCRVNCGKDPKSTPFSQVLRRVDEWPFNGADRLGFLMLQAVKDVNADRCSSGGTLLHVAVLRNQAGWIDILLEKGADIEATDNFGMTPLVLACRCSPKMLPILIERGADVHVKYKSNAGILAAAAAHGNVDSLKYLINYGLDINVRTEKGYPPLACALNWAHEKAALYLMEQGADIKWGTQDERQTALHFAAEHGMEKAMEQLLKRDLDVNAKDSGGWTPLHLACAIGSAKVAEMLLDAGADMEPELANKDRPLHVALINEKEDIAKLLLERGADITVRASKSRTPLHLAAEYSVYDAARILLDRSVSTEDTDDETWTPLCCVSRLRRPSGAKIAQLLAERGAKVNYGDKDNWTPIHQAVYHRDYATVSSLMFAGADVQVRTTDDGLNVLERVDDMHDENARRGFTRTITEVQKLRERYEREGRCLKSVDCDAEDEDEDKDVELVEKADALP